MGSDHSNSEFDLETFMSFLSPKGGDLPLGTLEDFWDADFGALFA